MSNYETFFNIIRAPEGKEEETFAAWKTISDVMQAPDECISTKLHRNRKNPNLLINCARLTSEEGFMAQERDPRFQELPQILTDLGVEREAGVYDVISTFGDVE